MTNAKLRIKLSIIIVYFGDFNVLANLLESIKKNKIKHSHEVIVVNNKSYEKIGPILRKKYKDAIYVESLGNIGYGGGNNLGVKHAKGKYLFIVNPDTRIVSGFVDNLINFLDDQKEAAIVAPNLVDTDGKLFNKQGTRMLTPLRAIFSLTILSKILPNNTIFREYYMLDVSKKNFREVDVVPGSAFMIRNKDFKKIGGFDEKFFLYFEEMDLCKRLRDRAEKIFMSPDLILEHDWSPNEGDNKLKKIFRESRFYYFNKHFGLFNALVVESFSRISKQNLFICFFLTALIILVFWN